MCACWMTCYLGSFVIYKHWDLSELSPSDGLPSLLPTYILGF